VVLSRVSFFILPKDHRAKARGCLFNFFDVTMPPNNYSEKSFYDLAVSIGSSLKMPKHLKLGSYLFDVKKNNTKNELSTTLIPWRKKVFVGANLHRKQEVEIKQYILIGAMPIEMPS
jgi:hypothetical protein